MRLRGAFGLFSFAVATMAVGAEYRIDPHYSPEPVSVAMTKALNKGAIVDVRMPVCRRRMDISGNREGLSSASLRKIDLQDHRQLLIEMLMITGAPMASDKAGQRVDDIIRSSEVRIYATRLDPDNSGHVRNIYVVDNTSCEPEWFSNPASPAVYVEAANGELDPYWGKGTSALGYPFFYRGQTYYAQWQSNGSRYPASLSLYSPLVVNEFNRSMFKQEGFGLVCSIEKK